MKKPTINAETAEAAEETKEFSACSARSAVHFLSRLRSPKVFSTALVEVTHYPKPGV
jgi:hypothetical protein